MSKNKTLFSRIDSNIFSYKNQNVSYYQDFDEIYIYMLSITRSFNIQN